MRKFHGLFRSNQSALGRRPAVVAGVRSPDRQTRTGRGPIGWMGCLALILWSLCLPGWVSAVDLTVFGPESFVRNSGSPVVETRTFTLVNPTQAHTLHLVNGGLQDDGTSAELVSSSEIFLNGVLVAGPSNFNQNVSSLSVPVTVQSLNTLTVELRGKPGGQITLRIERDANQIPQAAAGLDQTVFVGDSVQLDGSGSTDAEGDPLSYLWQLVLTPQGSQAVLNNTTTINPTLDIDQPGSYEAELVVNDGFEDSLPDRVMIDTQNSAPVANAGTDQTAFVNEIVSLDGTGSSDIDHDPISYQWNLVGVPTGSQTTLQTPNTAITDILIDQPGHYIAELIVNDGSINSAPDQVAIDTLNSAPVASAGLDLSAFVGNEVLFDGIGSSDIDGDPLTYSWSLLSKPAGSSATLLDANTEQSRFTPDVAGLYVVQLIVQDAVLASAPDTATVTAVSGDTTPPTIVVTNPPNGLVTNQAAQTITGDLNEPGVLIVNGQAVPLASDNSFIHQVTLIEGSNSFTLAATDIAGNTANATLTLVLDTVAPTGGNPSLITTTYQQSGTADIIGAAGSVEPGATVVITNTRSGESITIIADANGGFSAQLAAFPGDTLSIVIIDSANNHSATSPFNVPAPFGGSTGYIHGSVFNAATRQPLAGVDVHVRGLPQHTSTGTNGRFTLAVAGGASRVLLLEKAGYVEARRDTYSRSGGDSTVGAVGMQPWGTQTVSISAATGGSFVDDTGNVEVDFPPGALPQDTAFQAAYLKDKASFPLPLPDNMVYMGGVQMGPEHIHFNQPVTVRLRNTLQFAAGTQVPYFFASHDENDPNEGFYDPGTGTVTSDGQFIEFQVDHFSCMALGIAPETRGGQATDQTNKQECSPPPGTKKSSNISHCQGNLNLTHNLPPFFAFGQDDAPTLVYNSRTASTQSIISTTFAIADVPNTVPDVIQARLSVEGQQTELFLSNSTTTVPFSFLWDGLNARGQPVPTGSYPFQLEASNVYSSYQGQSLTDPYADSIKVTGRVMVDNKATSPFGAGWGLQELERIHRNPDGTLLLTGGNGSATVFRPPANAQFNTAPLSTLASGFSDSRSIAVAPDGGYYVSSLSTGTIAHIAPNGSQTQIASGIINIKGIAVAQDGTIYAGSERGGTIYRIPVGGAPVILTQLLGTDHVDDLAVGPEGNIYVLDGGFGVIQKVTPSGQSSLFYDGRNGPSPRLLSNSMSLTFDRVGNLYVSNNFNTFGRVSCGRSFISKFDRLGNHSYHYVGLNVPRGIAMDDSGNLFVADYDCNGDSYQIKVITPDGDEGIVVDNIAGDVNAFGLAYDLALNNGTLALVRPGTASVSAGDVLTLGVNVDSDSYSFSRFTATGSGNYSEIQQDAQGNLTRVARNGTQTKYNPQGLHIETQRPQGLSWKYQYDAQQRLITRTNTAGSQWTFSYGTAGLNRITDPAGRQVDFTVDTSTNLTEVTEPEGATMHYVYDNQHRIVTKTDSRNFSTQYTYGPIGNVTQVDLPNGEVRQFSAGKVAHTITPTAADASSSINPIVLPPQNTVDNSYTNGRGHTTRTVTNRYGAVLKHVDGLGNETTFERSSENSLTDTTLPNGSVISNGYDPQRQLVRQSLEVSTSEELFVNYTYDTQFRLTGLDSNYLPAYQFSYDTNYNPIQITTGDTTTHITTNLTYNAFGLPLTSETGGETTIFEYDLSGHLTRLTNPAGETTEFGYDVSGNRTLARDALGRERHFTYDSLGRLTTVTEPNGDLSQFAYQPACATCGRAVHLLTSVTDALDQITQFEYDELGQLIRETDSAGHITSYTYDASRNLETKTDPNGNVIRFVYDANDRLIEKRLPNETVTYSYDAMGNLLTAIDDDSTLAFTYDTANRNIQVDTGGLNQIVSVANRIFQGYQASYISYDRLASGYGKFFQLITLDALRRPSNLSFGQFSGIFDLSYDSQGRRVSLSSQRFIIGAPISNLSYGYDAASRLLSLTGTGVYPGDVNYTYDAVGNVDNRLEQFAVDNSASLDKTQITAQVLDVTGQVATNHQVLINNQVIPTQTNGTLQGQVPLTLGQNTLDIVAEDSTGKRVFSTTKIITRNPLATGLSLDRVEDIAPNGDVYVIDNSQQAQLVAAGSGVLSLPTWLSGATDVGVTGGGLVYMLKGTDIWQYDGITLSQVADVSSVGTLLDMEVGPDDQVYLATSDTIYRIQAGTAIAHGTVPIGASGPTLLLDASAYGLVLGSAQNGGFYRIDPDGSVNSLFTTFFFFSLPPFAVDPQGIICFGGDVELGGAECRNPDGSSAPFQGFLNFSSNSLEFDDSGVAHTSEIDNVFAWSGSTKTPLVTTTPTVTPIPGTLTIDVLGPSVQDFTYDSKDQLTGVASYFGDETYTYDGVGNRASDHRASNYQYNARNQLISGNGVTYDYDANGNRVRKATITGATDYSWDSENQLIRIDFPNGSTAEYAYDASGRRIQKRLIDSQGVEAIQLYRYDREDIIGIYDGNDLPIIEFAHGIGIDEPLSMIRNGVVYIYTTDALGSVIAITDAQNNVVVQRYRYDSYGNIIGTFDPSFEQPYGFTGREYDSESGLYYNRARYYDPRIGGFISADQVGLAGGLNRYTYVENNPANLIDPTGQVAQAIRLVEPVGVGVGASFACILNVDLCRAVITEVCNDISQAVDSLVDLILNNESSDDGNPDIKKPGTARNLDGTRKSPMDQEDQLRDFRDSGGLVDDMSKSRGRRKSFLKDLKDIPLDELDDFLDGNGI